MKRKLIGTNNAVRVSFTKEQYDRAVARSKSHPDRTTDPRSITRGHGLITGCLGEIIVEDFLLHVKQCDDHDRDLKDKFNFDLLMADGTTIEVKSKGHGVSDCPSFYDASVSAFNPRQKADYYVFVRVHGKRLRDSYGFDHSNSEKAWICGMKAKDEIIQPHRLMKRGTVVQNSSSFDYVAKTSSYQIKISDLDPLPNDFGKSIDLLKEGTLTRSAVNTVKGFEQDEFFLLQQRVSDSPATCIVFEGLSDLTTKEKVHFEEHVEKYVYDTLSKEEWSMKRFRKVE